MLVKPLRPATAHKKPRHQQVPPNADRRRPDPPRLVPAHKSFTARSMRPGSEVEVDGWAGEFIVR